LPGQIGHYLHVVQGATEINRPTYENQEQWRDYGELCRRLAAAASSELAAD
jgi:hypothetical protein